MALDCTWLAMAAGACSVAEGREPWGGAPVLPSLEIGDHEAGIWALSADPQGRTLVTGTEDGCVAAWDVRGRACIWQVGSFFQLMLLRRAASSGCMHWEGRCVCCPRMDIGTLCQGRSCPHDVQSQK